MSDLPSIGSFIDRRYRVRREIARGAVGVVYEADHGYTGRPVAVKLLVPEQRRVEDSQIRLMYEAQALNRVRHAGIVDVLDAGVDEAYGPYLVTELLSGRTLEGLLTARRRLGNDETRAIGLRLCDALAWSHSRGVIHRDIKPGNVFIARSESGREFIKLFDFGIARLERPGARKLTVHGTVLGTPEYMSPEQLHGSEEIDERSDIYALGVTLFECATGNVPFEGNYADVLLKSATVDMPTVRSQNPEASPDLARAIEVALHHDPRQRHASMRAFGESLARANASPGAGAGSGALSGEHSLLSGQAGRNSEPRAGEAAAPAKRRFPRAPYVTPVRVMRADGTTIDGRSEDVSIGGFLTVLTQSVAQGELVRVRFALPIVGKIAELEATTRWIRTARGKDAVGLEFRAITTDVREAIERYVTAMGGA
jgi:serine/threonine protein kinase